MALLDFSGGKLILTVNPARFQSCNSPSQHPNWLTYPLWPGVYNECDTTQPTSQNEGEYFAMFLETAAEDPLYTQLKALDGCVVGSTSG